MRLRADTDAIQSIAMIAGVVVCLICTLNKIEGGLSGMFTTLKDADMLQYHELLEFHPTRHEAPAESVWALGFGVGILSLAQMATDQLAVQRFLTAKDLGNCVRSFVYSSTFSGLFTILMGFNSLCILGFYKQQRLDPLKAGRIEEADQILPYFAITELPHG